MYNAIKCFKLKDFPPRKSQELVINAIEDAYKTKKIVVLEAPVGSGKSAIAMAIARWLGSSHILTPRKSLQDQYYNDFPDEVVTMKGKSGYPCYPRLQPLTPAKRSTSDNGKVMYIPSKPKEDVHRDDYETVVNLLVKRIPVANLSDLDCSEGPCVTSTAVKKNCENADDRPCPYNVALDVAEATDHIIHNVHSFFYQTLFGSRFGPRDLMIIDEAHDLSSILRDFLRAKVMIPFDEMPETPAPSPSDSIKDWVSWFLLVKGLSFGKLNSLYSDLEFSGQIENYYKDKGRWVSEEPTSEGGVKLVSTPEKRYAESLIKLMTGFQFEKTDEPTHVVSEVRNDEKGRVEYTITPISLSGKAKAFFLDMGNFSLLMSGTIYDKKLFCSKLGIPFEEVEFIRIGSEFPVANRPIILKGELATDNSFAAWRDDPEALDTVVDNIKKIMDVYHDRKGLIHAPSYSSARYLESLLNSERIITHTPQNFMTTLSRFCKDTTSNDVLLSPTCQQGVDFKDDIARFQIIIRVPYLSTEDEFISYMMKKDFSWYNYQSLIIFGQQIGRVVRGPKDWGHTYLLDSRFKRYLQRNSKILPGWLKDAIQFK